MSWTPATFRAVLEEFENISDAVIQDALSEAALEVRSSVFGQKTDSAVKWRAADLLARRPFGEMARIDKTGKTIYLERYQEIVNQVAYGYRVI